MIAAAAVAETAARIHARVEWPGLEQGAAGLAELVLAVVVVFAVVVLYHRERAGTAGGLRWVSCALRLFCLAALGVILLRPSLARDAERPLAGRVVVLADASASMSVKDANLPPELAAGWQKALGLSTAAQAAELTRHDVLRRLLAGHDYGLIKAMGRANEVDIISFAEDARAVLKVRWERQEEKASAAGAPPALPDWKPTGAVTDLAGALRAALDQPGPGPLAAIVVLSDGRDTEGGDLDAVAELAAARKVPLNFVGIGSPLMARNVEAVELFSNEHALKGLPLEMRVFLQSQGYAGQAATLVLTATDVKSGKAEEVLRKQIVLAADGVRQVVDLTAVPQAVGAVRYAAAVEPLEGESRTDDNSASREVSVTDQKVRVLLIAGEPSIEYRFLKALISRDPAFALTVRLHGAAVEEEVLGAPSEGAPPAEGLAPVEAGGAGTAAGRPPPAGLAELSSYDVVVLWDPAPLDVTADRVAVLGDLVERKGLGLAFVAGPTHSPELLTDAALRQLRDLLPAAVDDARTRALIGNIGPFTEVRPIELGEGAAGHSVLNMGGEEARFWGRVPGLYWVLPAARPKPGATVLLRCADPAFPQGVVLAAVQSYGLGRVFYCGTPETWRWRRLGISYYDRFWLQALRYCAGGRAIGADKRARISLERSVYPLGDPVNIHARLFDAQMHPLEADRAELAVESEGRHVGAVELRRQANEAGLYKGVFYPEEFGTFQLIYSTTDGLRSSVSLQVRRPDVEFRDLRMARQTMEEMARKTGGRYFEPSEVEDLPKAVPGRSRIVTEPGPLEPLWDTPILLVVLVAALTAEWIMRRRMGMI